MQLEIFINFFGIILIIMAKNSANTKHV